MSCAVTMVSSGAGQDKRLRRSVACGQLPTWGSARNAFAALLHRVCTSCRWTAVVTGDDDVEAGISNVSGGSGEGAGQGRERARAVAAGCPGAADRGGRGA